MSRSEELCMTYTVSRLSETAKTFRRLGEAYESASGEEAQSPCFKHQLFLVADILDDCTLMQMQADKPSDRKSTRLNSSHDRQSRMPSSA